MSYLPKDCPILFKYGPKKCRGHAACTTPGLPPPPPNLHGGHDPQLLLVPPARSFGNYFLPFTQ